MPAGNILIIDDSPIDAWIASKILMEAGYNTTIYRDGYEAMKASRQLQPDLILLDVGMPRVDGYQLCRQLKADPYTKDTLTVLYSIRDQSLDCLWGIEAGADDFIVKTLSREDFLNRVNKILTERSTSIANLLEPLELDRIQQVADIEDVHELVQLLYSTFNKHLWHVMRRIWGADVTSVLIYRAIEKVAGPFSFFRNIHRVDIDGLMLDPKTIEGGRNSEVIDGFRTFIIELYLVVVKFSRTRDKGDEDTARITAAVKNMIDDLLIRNQQREERTPKISSPEEPLSISAEPTETVEPIWSPTPPSLRLECSLDTRGALISCSDDLTRLLGYTRNEMIGQPFSNLLTVDGRETFDLTLIRLPGKGVDRISVLLKTIGNALMHVEADLTALYDSEGYFVLTRCEFEIIQGPPIVRQEIEKLQQSLQTLTEELGGLGSTLSHDLKQPVHAIMMISQFLEDEYSEQLDEQAQGYVKSIQEAADRMQQQIDDLAQFSRIVSSTNAYEEVNIEDLVEEVRQEMSPMLEEHNAQLTVTGKLPTVVCDQERSKTLLRELVTNGVKFNNQAQPVVEIGSSLEGEPEHTVYVKDNGIGIDEPHHEAIFRLFHRLHGPDEFPGTGTGLAICRRIVESHGGHIWVLSKEGEGATFLFTIPRHVPLH